MIFLFLLLSLCVQMIGVVRVLAWISPGNVHLPGSQINDHGRDGAFAIQGIDAIDIVVANRVRQVDVIFLDRLQRLDIVS